MILYETDCPYVISSFGKHKEVKQKILDVVDSYPFYKSLVDQNSNIYKTDWNSNINPYLCLIEDDLKYHMSLVFKNLGFSKFLITDLWLQQYVKGSSHGWHVHQKCQWNSIYYLEFPDGSVGTEFINPFNKKVFIPEVKEGEILTIPSFLQHRAPLVTEDIRRTVIAFNCDAFN